jgi:hypothetical protein
MMGRTHQIAATAGSLMLAVWLPHGSAAQNLGTIGTGVAGESTARGTVPWTPPTGPAPRLASGRPDFSGVWDHPYVPDMGASNTRTPGLQTGAGPLPYTAAGLENFKSYNPERDGDYTGMCMPFGLMRSVNAPYPFQIMQSDRYVTFLFEQSNWFTIVPFREAHSKEPSPTWFGESIARWDGDTLVIDTLGFNGFTRLDTRGNPHSDQLHLVQRLTRTDAGHIAYSVTVDDPVYYTKPWTNTRIFTLADTELLEYSCEENNRSLWEGRIKIWQVPGAEPLRPFGGR